MAAVRVTFLVWQNVESLMVCPEYGNTKYFLEDTVMNTKTLFFIVTAVLSVAIAQSAFSHCDTMDGPVVGDANLAMERNNVNYVLKWVHPENEKEVADAFALVMKVRKQGPDAKALAEKYFYDVLVRIHRNGEGESFTGVKPHGVPVDEAILAADKCIEKGNLAPLEAILDKEKMPELKKLFDEVMSLRKYDVNDLKKARAYIEAYVHFFKFAEGEEEGAHGSEI